MGEIQLVIENGVPQVKVDACMNCTSKFGISKCKVKNRGCCHYFPKFYLEDIHRMVKSKEGMETLNKILSLEKVQINEYYIHAIGYFDKEEYNKYIKSYEGCLDKEEDKTIYFRACPFVEPGKGCTINPEFRTDVCNFFICNEITENLKDNELYKKYLKERESYIDWLEYENISLQKYFEDKKLDLVNNINEIINELKEIPLETYEFLHFPKVNY